MATLKNFPFKNQLSQPTSDGQPEENRFNDCIPTCLAAGLQYFTSKPFNGDQVKDSVYGQGFMGVTDISDYVGYLSKQGIKFYQETGTPAERVAGIHEHIKNGEAVAVIIQWNHLPPADPGYPYQGHCIIFFSESPNSLSAMNPWNGYADSGSDDYWAARLCFYSNWIMKGSTSMPVPQNWTDDGKTLRAPNGKTVSLGFRQHILNAPTWNKENIPVEQEVHADILEHSNPRLGPGQRQVFRYTFLEWTPTIGVCEGNIGDELVYVYGELEAASAAKSQAEAATTQALSAQKAAEDKAAALQKELDALKASPAPSPLPVPSIDTAGIKTLLNAAYNNIADAVTKL